MEGSRCTVVGWLDSTGETLTETVRAAGWLSAARLVADEWAGEFGGFAVVLQGCVEMVGRWETLPLGPPKWTPKAIEPVKFTVFGFDHAADREHADLISAPDWVTAAHTALRLRCGQGAEAGQAPIYRLISVARGVQMPIGTWTAWKQGLNRERIARYG